MSKQWSETCPTKPGWYWWRYGKDTDPELVLVWESKRRGLWNYGWTPGVLLAKRMHEPEPDEVSALVGLWQKSNGEAVPVTPKHQAEADSAPEKKPNAKDKETPAQRKEKGSGGRGPRTVPI